MSHFRNFRGLTLSLILTLGLAFGMPSTARAASDLSGIFQHYLDHPDARPSDEVLKRVKEDQVFLISGNGTASCQKAKDPNKQCFGATRKIFKSYLGVKVPDSAIFYSSDSKAPDAVSRAADQIAEKLMQRFQKSHKPLLVYAHSMGGPEIFLALLRHPELLDHAIDKVLITSGSMCGSKVDPGVRSLELPNLASHYRDAYKKLSVSPADLAKRFREHVVFSTVHHENDPHWDGAIPLKWQTPDSCFSEGKGLGVRLGTIYGDHCSFYCGGKVDLNNPDTRVRSAYFEAITDLGIKGLAQSVNSSSSTSERSNAEAK